MNVVIQLLGHGNTICSDNWCVPREMQMRYRLYNVMGGKARYSSCECSLDLQKGHFYIIPNGSVFEITHAPSSPFNVTWIDLYMYPCINRHIIDIIPEQYPALNNLLLSAREMFNQNLEHSDYEMICRLIISQVSKIRPMPLLEDERIAKIIQYIDANISGDVSTRKLAIISGFDRSYFSRLFTGIIGVSPSEYVRSKRMGMAMNLLKANSVKQVAAIVGYTDEKVFSRAFRAFTGFSPSACKK